MTVDQFPTENDFFSSNQPPRNLKDISERLLNFLNHHKQLGRLNPTDSSSASNKIVLVTSGGTTVPLENNTVRFIDNFSAGTRGSLSAEYFLNHGYLVIFLHREFSLLPFLNHFGHLNFLDLLQLEGSNAGADIDSQEVTLDQLKITELQKEANLKQILKDYKYHTANCNYLLISFTTINEYLFILRAISQDLKNFYRQENFKILIYLAAAVSDFFIPQAQLPEHKIQSNASFAKEQQQKQLQFQQKSQDQQLQQQKQLEIATSASGKLRLNLDPVPKFLKSIVDNWYNNSFVVSFKLETDDALLIRKCKQALEKYDHQLVIGNLLQSRKEKVVFVKKDQHHHHHHHHQQQKQHQVAADDDDFKETWFRLSAEKLQKGASIESVFIPEVIKLHNQWISSFKH